MIITAAVAACTMSYTVKKIEPANAEFNRSENFIVYIGHATVLIHLDGVNIITDPLFGDHLGYFAKRYIEPGIKFEKLPPLDAILISHEHIDHLDKPTLKRFPKDIPVIISKGLGKRIQKLGFTDVREMDLWESTGIKGIAITATQAQHIFSRSSGFVIKGSKTVFFAGDTGLFDGFREVGGRFTIDTALLPIGDYHPRLWFIPGFRKMTRDRHMAPDDIPDAVEMLRARAVVPIHWGTFKISGTGLHEPVERLKKIIAGKDLDGTVFILNHGGVWGF